MRYYVNDTLDEAMRAALALVGHAPSKYCGARVRSSAERFKNLYFESFEEH